MTHCLYKIAYALATCRMFFYTVYWVYFEVAWLCGCSDFGRHFGHLIFLKNRMELSLPSTSGGRLL